MEDVPNSIDIGPTNPIQILNQHDFLKILYVPLNDTFSKNKKNIYIDVGIGAPQQRQEA